MTAAAGVSALLVTCAPAFLAVKYAGAAYVVFLGVSAILATCRRDPPQVAPARAGDAFRRVVASVGDLLRRSAVRRRLSAVAGACWWGLGVRLATERS